MARMSRSEASGGAAGVRLFLALDLPAPARRRIARWRDSLVEGRPELRPVAAESLHVTMIFLGRRPQGQVERIWDASAAATEGLRSPMLTPEALVPVPPRRPRLLALDLDDRGGRAAAVQSALSRGLEGAGLHRPEARAFWPHVTLARVRARTSLGKLDAPPPPRTSFGAPLLTLYRSDLHPSGARYAALERVELAR